MNSCPGMFLLPFGKAIYVECRWDVLYTSKAHPQMFYEIGAFKNSTKFTGKYFCQGPFLILLDTYDKDCGSEYQK